jgi:nucleoid-associated protein YgaU
MCALLVWPAQSFARALIRIIDAVPGAGRLSLKLGERATLERLGATAFAQTTKWRGLRSGRFHWSLVKQDPALPAATTVASGTAAVGRGAYDLVLLAPQPRQVTLATYPARGGVRGASLLRVIHAAPELGSPELRLDGTTVSSSIGFRHATRYLRLTPGLHDLTALTPGNATPLLAAPRLRLLTGRAYSEILVGTRGERLRWVTVTDRGAPLTRASAHNGQPRGSSSRSIVVRPGDSLWTIAAHHLGAGAGNEAIEGEVIAIWNLNAGRIGTGDPNLIFPGQVILFPLAATL